MEKDQLTWWNILEKLQTLLRTGAKELYERLLISEEEMHDFIMSGTFYVACGYTLFLRTVGTCSLKLSECLSF